MVDLLSTTDPQRWAQAFEDRFGPRILADNGEEIDQGDLIGWFANAMQAKESSLLGSHTHKLTTEELHELVFQAGGAATAPCLAACPDLVMPTEEVTEGINRVLSDHGYPEAARHDHMPSDSGLAG